MVQLFYTTYISVYLAHHEIFRAKVGKGGRSRLLRCFANIIGLISYRDRWCGPSADFSWFTKFILFSLQRPQTVIDQIPKQNTFKYCKLYILYIFMHCDM